MREQTTQSRPFDAETRARMLRESWERMQSRKAAGQAVDPAGEDALRRLVERFCPDALGEGQSR